MSRGRGIALTVVNTPSLATLMSLGRNLSHCGLAAGPKRQNHKIYSVKAGHQLVAGARPCDLANLFDLALGIAGKLCAAAIPANQNLLAAVN